MTQAPPAHGDDVGHDADRAIANTNQSAQSLSENGELELQSEERVGPSPPSETTNGTPAYGAAVEVSPEDHLTPDKATDGETRNVGVDGKNTNDSVRHEEEMDDSEEEDDDDDEDGDEDEDDDDDDEEEEEEEEENGDDEPRLKRTRLTPGIPGVYRNGDATSAFLVAGDKMIIGTHNGNIHVLQLPTFQPIKVYHAHQASVTGISISPFPPPLPSGKVDVPRSVSVQLAERPPSQQSNKSPVTSPRKTKDARPVPRIPSNDIFIGTSSMDGNICVQSLVDGKDVSLRNFARPLQTVALSPDYRSDRSYISGGLSGQLILTVGGSPGRSTSTTTGSAAATASSWLGSMGLSNSTGKDTILHSGEGTISSIKWSLSGKYVVWLNEHGIKIMRSNLHLDATEMDNAWKRIGHIDRPQTEEWETMASVWRGRIEWIDEKSVEPDDEENATGAVPPSPAAASLSKQAAINRSRIEKLLVGWGTTIWLIYVHPENTRNGTNPGTKSPGSAEIVKILRLDCLISGISLYTPALLLVLAFPMSNDEEDLQVPDAADQERSSKTIGPTYGIKRRSNNAPPELRLIDIKAQTEVDRDVLDDMKDYAKLSASDYHLGVLPAQNAASVVASSRGTLETLAGFGTDMWNVAINPMTIFSSGASIRSGHSGDHDGVSASIRSGKPNIPAVHAGLVKPGAKIFIHSPYDCFLATKRDLGDHLEWLLEHQQHQKAWELLDENPEILATVERLGDLLSSASTHRQHDDATDNESITDSAMTSTISSLEREKARIGELWIQDLVKQDDWKKAGETCGRVLKLPEQWERWVLKFADAEKFDDICQHMPTELQQPPLPTSIYEVILVHYIQQHKPRFKELLDRWPTELFDIGTTITALENQIKYRDVREDSIDDGEHGRDWRLVTESLARLYEANGRQREALKCYIKLQDADAAFRLIKEYHLTNAVADDIPSFIGLRVPPGRLQSEKDFDVIEEATSEAIGILVDEAQHGLVRPDTVVKQLESRRLKFYLYLYLKALWKGEGLTEQPGEHVDRIVMDSRSLVDDFADLAVYLFAVFQNRPLLMQYLRSSTSYTFEKAVQECDELQFYDELVYLYSKTGQMKRALYLIIDSLKDVHKAIEFTKEQDDPDLWDDLLNYSMDKPSFIRGLLEQAGTSINPVELVKRIPEGLEIEGLRDGLMNMMKEHEIQHSISSGVGRVLRSEVSAAQKELRIGQQKGIKFEVHVPGPGDQADPSSLNGSITTDANEKGDDNRPSAQPGHCARCREAFTEFETEVLLGYACGHVFHITHLLEMLHPGKQIDADQARPEAKGSRYWVGAKVMRAWLLKDQVQGGCPLCHPRSVRVS